MLDGYNVLKGLMVQRYSTVLRQFAVLTYSALSKHLTSLRRSTGLELLNVYNQWLFLNGLIDCWVELLKF